MAWLELYHYSIEHHHYPKDRDYLLSLLDQYEQERFERYKFDHSKWTFATARWLLKQNLSSHLKQSPADIKLSYNANGKPFVEQSSVYFSLSHTEKSVVLAISDTEVGVDVELMDRRGAPWNRPEAFLNSHLAPVLNAIHDEEQKKRCFCRYWTAMEARVKVKGASLFTIKEAFGQHIEPMTDDGAFDDGTFTYLSHDVGARQQLSLCISDELKQVAFFNSTEQGNLLDSAMSCKFGATGTRIQPS